MWQSKGTPQGQKIRPFVGDYTETMMVMNALTRPYFLGELALEGYP